MGTVLKALLSSATGVLGGVWGYVAVAGVAATLAGTGAGLAVHKFDLVTYQRLQLKDAKAAVAVAENQTIAVTGEKDRELAQAHAAGRQAVTEQKSQDALRYRTKTITQEITRYVTVKADAVSCIPYALIRVLNAAVGDGFKPAEAIAAAGGVAGSESDGACAPIPASDFAEQLIEKLIQPGQANAEQLNALEAAVKELAAAHDTP